METIAQTPNRRSCPTNRLGLRGTSLFAVVAVSSLGMLTAVQAGDPDVPAMSDQSAVGKLDGAAFGQSRTPGWSMTPMAGGGSTISASAPHAADIKASNAGAQTVFSGFGQTFGMVREVWDMLSTSPSVEDEEPAVQSESMSGPHQTVKASASGFGGWCVNSNADGRCALLLESMSEQPEPVTRQHRHRKPCPSAKSDLSA